MTTTDGTVALGQDFRRLLVAAGASNLGDGIRLTALPLLALRLTDDPVLVAAVSAMTFLPAVLFGPIGGAIVDRHDRRRLLVWGQLARAAAVAVFVLAVVGGEGSIWALYALAVVLGAGEVLVDGAAQAVVPAMVPTALLERANGRVISVQLVLDDLVGTSLGGLLFAAAPVLPFVVDGVTFLVGGLVAATISRPFTPATAVTAGTAIADDADGADGGSGEAAEEPATTLLGEAREGVRFVLAMPVLRDTAIAVSLSNLAAMTGTSVLVLLVVDDLGASEAVFGFVMAAGAVGGVLASTASERLVRGFGRGPVLVGACVVDTLGAGLLAWSPSVAVVAVGMATFVGAVMAFNVPARAVRQEVTPDHLLGRVVASYRVLGYAGVPVGALLGGVVTQLAGVRAAFVVMAALLVVVTIVMVGAVRHLPARP